MQCTGPALLGPLPSNTISIGARATKGDGPRRSRCNSVHRLLSAADQIAPHTRWVPGIHFKWIVADSLICLQADALHAHYPRVGFQRLPITVLPTTHGALGAWILRRLAGGETGSGPNGVDGFGASAIEFPVGRNRDRVRRHLARSLNTEFKKKKTRMPTNRLPETRSQAREPGKWVKFGWTPTITLYCRCSQPVREVPCSV